ncbi:MAG: sigma-54-dependent Fis family transcriptional regulator [Acidobacteria bacterium]|nr:sigma-54-dependent Fis family transcriptional regulator [Acidobacteriota bacterium]MCB9377492.1 sigma-54-dependent Fis family transcriptional regulator [Holophagales bacterium]
MNNILVVDDEEILQDVLGLLLRKEGFRPLAAKSGEDALLVYEKEPVDLVLLDLMLPGMSGLEVLKQIRQRDPEQVVIVITAYSSIEGAIEAMREGAFHYIPKPFKNEEVLLTIRKGLEQKRLQSENRVLKEELQKRYGLDNIIGKSQPMQQVFDLIRLAAPSKSNILILGESGTGKELVAKAIHHHSRRAQGPFVTVNSGSMPPDLLESTLFGHVKGAFTGAITAKKGLFEIANNGSIFFDEIGNIPLDTQAKLLRVIQEREFMRLGGVETIKVDVRIVAATNADLDELVQSGGFREDLYYRMNVITISLPPLRRRTEDIPLLARHFLQMYSAENGKPIQEISPGAMKLLMDYRWPGNVRELENAIERAVVLSTSEILDVDLLPPTLKGEESLVAAVPTPTPSQGMSFWDAVNGYERQLIVRALQAAGGVQKKAAELLQVKPTTLHEMMKRLSISAETLNS